MGTEEIKRLYDDLRGDFRVIIQEQETIHRKLESLADGKNLKGDEIVGWLGEIYAKLLLGGRLVSDEFEHDLETRNGKRISVKTRKGTRTRWNLVGHIHRIDFVNHPTHLMFVHLNDDYSPERIWLYQWEDLVRDKRFKVHKVRGDKIGHYFEVKPEYDVKYEVYPRVRSEVTEIAHFL
jgi:hypothetical protein